MDFISEEFLAARTGEALEARLRDSASFRQQMKCLHEASKAFSRGRIGVVFQNFNEQGNDTRAASRYIDEWNGS